jgi:nitrogen fixation NifU-like protein
MNSIYDEIILDHNAHPQFFSELEKPDFSLKAINASCGDKFEIQLKLEGDKISEVGFKGVGCAVSKASTDILLSKILSKSLDEAKKICEEFLAAVHDGDFSALSGEVLALENVSKMPARVKCATLSWQTILSS